MDGRWDRFEVEVFLILALAWVRDGHRLHQRLRIGVQRVFKHLLTGANLNDPPQIHHADIVADTLHHGHVVADEEEAQLHLLLQFHHQVEHLRLHRHVQSRDGLIRDDQLGV